MEGGPTTLCLKRFMLACSVLPPELFSLGCEASATFPKGIARGAE